MNDNSFFVFIFIFIIADLICFCSAAVPSQRLSDWPLYADGHHYGTKTDMEQLHGAWLPVGSGPFFVFLKFCLIFCIFRRSLCSCWEHHSLWPIAIVLLSPFQTKTIRFFLASLYQTKTYFNTAEKTHHYLDCLTVMFKMQQEQNVSPLHMM